MTASTTNDEVWAWPLGDGSAGRCAVAGCASRAAWQQYVDIGEEGSDSGYSALLELCPFHAWELVDDDTEHTVRTHYHRCLSCGGAVGMVEFRIEELPGRPWAKNYDCMTGCGGKWAPEDMSSGTRKRLYAAWAAEQPADEEEG